MVRCSTITSFVVGFTLISCLSASARPPDSKIKEVIERYTRSLRHENVGVVGTTIFNLMQVKMLYPEADLTKAVRDLNRLIVDGETAAVRYKAFLATNYFENADWFALMEGKRQDEMEHVFSVLSQKVNSQLLSLNDPS